MSRLNSTCKLLSVAQQSRLANPSSYNFFNATYTPLDDGRNILLQWELEFDGGPDVVLFEVEFRDSEGNLLDTFELDIDAGSYLVENLEPVTTYSFSAVALNDIGPTAPITVEATTTLGTYMYVHVQ